MEEEEGKGGGTKFCWLLAVREAGREGTGQAWKKAENGVSTKGVIFQRLRPNPDTF